jgi:hypothetical protein
MTAQPYQVTVTDKTNPDGQRVIRTGLREYNREMAGYADARGLSVFVSDPETKKIIGGLLGRTSLGLFFIDLFFIPKALRGMGSARRQLNARKRRREVADALWPCSTQSPFRRLRSMNGRGIGCSAASNAGLPATPAFA